MKVVREGGSGSAHCYYHYYYHYHHVKVATALIDAGASLSPPNQYGATPLHFAAQKGNVEFCQLLIARGADKEATNLNGVMPWETVTPTLTLSRPYPNPSPNPSPHPNPNPNPNHHPHSRPHPHKATGELRPLLGGPPLDMHVAVQKLDLVKLASLVDEGSNPIPTPKA